VPELVEPCVDGLQLSGDGRVVGLREGVPQLCAACALPIDLCVYFS
jgi:hypothetical protein